MTLQAALPLPAFNHRLFHLEPIMNHSSANDDDDRSEVADSLARHA